MIVRSLILSLCAASFLAAAEPIVLDPATNAPPPEPLAAMPASGTGVRQGSIVWDTTHGVYLNYSPSSRFSNLVTMLSDSGFTMELCGSGVHTIDLEQYDVIVICVGSSWYSAYTQEEADSLYAYYCRDHQRVILTGDMNFCENTYITYADNTAFAYNIFEWLSSSGGGILIMGDNPGCPNANISLVNDTFAMQSGVATINPADLYFTNFGAFSIFDGITQIYYRASGSVAARAPAVEAAWTSANEPTIALLDQSLPIEEDIGRRLDRVDLRVSPNPFRTTTTFCMGQRAQGTELRIYDIGGCLIRSFALSPIHPVFYWDGNDRFGHAVPHGVYFVTVGGAAPVKAVKLR